MINQWTRRVDATAYDCDKRTVAYVTVKRNPQKRKEGLNDVEIVAGGVHICLEYRQVTEFIRAVRTAQSEQAYTREGRPRRLKSEDRFREFLE